MTRHRSLMAAAALCLILSTAMVKAQSSVAFPGAVRGLYGFSYGGTPGYNEYARRYRRPVSGGYRGGALPVSGGYRGGALPSGGYRGVIPSADYYDDLDSTYDYYGSPFYGRGYRPYRSRGGYPNHNYHNYY